MAFRHGLISFLIIIVTALILITAGIILFVKFRNGFNTIRVFSIILILIGIIMMLFSKKVCIRNVRLKEDIAITPIKELQISENIKSLKDIMEGIESFNSFNVNTSSGVNTAVPVKRTDGIVEMLTGIDSKGSHLEIKTYIYDSIQNACNSYDSDYRYYGKHYGIMESSGTKDKRYFITYKNQLRASPESLYELMDSYMTYVYFQKGNVIIELREDRDEDHKSKMESYINLLAKSLSKLE